MRIKLRGLATATPRLIKLLWTW